MAAKGGVIVVRRLRKQTHLSIADPTGSLRRNMVVAGLGVPNRSTYTGKIKRVNAAGTVGQARIKCTAVGLRFLDETETGVLKVTITGGPPVDDVPVTYVDDPESCDEPNPILKPKRKPAKKKKSK